MLNVNLAEYACIGWISVWVLWIHFVFVKLGSGREEIGSLRVFFVESIACEILVLPG